MHCPYCAEEIKDQAVVCKHCHRDLFIVRPLLDKLTEMSNRVQMLENVTGGAGAASAGGGHVASRRSFLPTLSASEAIAFTFILLVLAHFLIIVLFDLNLVYLRIVSILVPLIFGFLCRESEKKMLLSELLIGAVIAIASILTMSAIVAKLDKVPFLPQTGYEWREFAYYSASIAFGFVTGVIIRHTLIALYAPSAKANKLIEMITRLIVAQLGQGGKPKFTLRIIRSIVSSVLGVGSAIISIVSGLWEFLK